MIRRQKYDMIHKLRNNRPLRVSFLQLRDVQNSCGQNFVELLMVVAILTIVVGGLAMTLRSGQEAWQTTDLEIRLQENLRLVIEKVGRELRESGSDSTGTLMVSITDGGTAVVGGQNVELPDQIDFSIPVICETGASVIDANGDVSNWGAPLTWGCSDSSCMDADDDCGTVDYSTIRYAIDGSSRLVRQVLDSTNSVVRTDIFAQNISNFQVVLSGDQNVITFTVTATHTSDLNRQLSLSEDMEIFLRNRG